jgi:hypothetical protein
MPASLTFGGYDANRVNMAATLTIPFFTNSAFDLQVMIEGIALNGHSSTAAAGISDMSAFIDSTVPELWLPQATCNSVCGT